MKKALLILLLVGIFIGAQGCALFASNQIDSLVPSESVTPSETETVAPIVTTEENFDQKPMVAISMQPVTETTSASDGTELAYYKYQNMSLVVPDPEIANKIIVDFLNRIDSTADRAAEISNAAKADFTSGAQWNPYVCQILYDPMRIDSNVLSLKGSYVCFSGSAHPETNHLAANYNLVTGENLEFDDILAEGVQSDDLTNAVVESLEAQSQNVAFYEGYQDTVRERLSQKIAKETSWYFSNAGLCLYFSPYEIAPYSAGLVVATIPYDKLTGLVNDAYFPSEMEIGTGAIVATVFDENALNDFTQIAEIVIDKENEPILLHTDSAVQHIRIEAGSWNANATEFTPEQTVFAAHSLTPGDAIMVTAATKDTLPTLRLTYNNATESGSYFITYDTQSSTPVLSDNP